MSSDRNRTQHGRLPYSANQGHMLISRATAQDGECDGSATCIAAVALRLSSCAQVHEAALVNVYTTSWWHQRCIDDRLRMTYCRWARCIGLAEYKCCQAQVQGSDWEVLDTSWPVLQAASAA